MGGSPLRCRGSKSLGHRCTGRPEIQCCGLRSLPFGDQGYIVRARDEVENCRRKDAYLVNRQFISWNSTVEKDAPLPNAQFFFIFLFSFSPKTSPVWKEILLGGCAISEGSSTLRRLPQYN